MTNNRQQGMTLIEMMITVMVLAVILIIAVPAYQNFIQDNRVSTEASRIFSAINIARGEALKRSLNVTVCPSTDGATCTVSTNWATGWIVLTATGDLINAWDASNANVNITASSNTGITYLPTGKKLTPAAYSLAVNYPGCAALKCRIVQITPTGGPAITKNTAAIP